jgi:hypothetical protein
MLRLTLRCVEDVVEDVVEDIVDARKQWCWKSIVSMHLLLADLGSCIRWRLGREGSQRISLTLGNNHFDRRFCPLQH